MMNAECGMSDLSHSAGTDDGHATLCPSYNGIGQLKIIGKKLGVGWAKARSDVPIIPHS